MGRKSCHPTRSEQLQNARRNSPSSLLSWPVSIQSNSFQRKSMKSKPAASEVLFILFLSTVSFAAAAEWASSPINLDSRHQLFLDDHLIASVARVQRTIDQAEKSPANPVLWPTEKWEPPM